MIATSEMWRLSSLVRSHGALGSLALAQVASLGSEKSRAASFCVDHDRNKVSRVEVALRGAKANRERRVALSEGLATQGASSSEAADAGKKRVAAFLDTTMRELDPAALVGEASIAKFAKGLTDGGLALWPPILGGESVPAELVHPDASCPACSQKRSPQHSAIANILDIAGVMVKKHIALRCRTRGCPEFNVYVWHNYRVKDDKHLFCGDPRKLGCIMLTSTFGCTMSYLRQLHLRMVREQVTFAGEAFVARHYWTDQGG